MNALMRAIVTEKSLKLTEIGQYSFRVSPRATKASVAAEVSALYKVTPVAVHMITIPGKLKRRGKTEGKRSDIHKAIVTLKTGQKIPEFSVGE